MYPPTKDSSHLDCVIVGHYDTGLINHENMLRANGVESGGYRNLRMDFVTLDGRKMSYLDVLNHLTGQQLHWTEMPQVGPVYLASYLMRRGFNVDFASFFKPKRRELEDMIKRTRVVAVTTTLYLNPIVAAEVVAFIREIKPEAHIVVGGPLIDNLHYRLSGADFRYTLEYIGADTYVLETDGEKTLANIVAGLKNGGGASKIKNCYVRMGERYVSAGTEREVNNLDEDPIAWNLFAHKSLGPTLQTRTALGCPFGCTFCDYPVRAGRYTTQSIDIVEKELLQVQARENVKNMVFIDDTFNVPIKRFKEILRMMIRNQFTFKWYSYLRCNLVDDELCELMRDSGCAGVFLGIESGDSDVLRNMKKMATPEQYSQGLKRLNDAEILSFASLIVGFPGETRQTVENTIELINEAKPTFFRGEIWFYNHRSPIHNDRNQFAIEGDGYRWRHKTMDWEEACDWVLKLFKDVNSSTWLPMYDMDFWIIPYLRGKGMTNEQIRNFVGLCSQLLADELGMDHQKPQPDTLILENQLRSYCEGLIFNQTAH